ncbi:MAG: hypothetical protein NZL85_08170, partial [Fimbriimonadales bacterium]|nr:hypothetical protein [Fimbriimonadales bacterium]
MNTLNFALIGAGGIGKHLAYQIKQMEQGLEMTEAQRSLPHFLRPEGWTVRLQGVYDENPAVA